MTTLPVHQRLGLVRATITEGLRRVKRLGAMQAFLTGYEPVPNALYSSVLPPDHALSEQWMKRW